MSDIYIGTRMRLLLPGLLAAVFFGLLVSVPHSVNAQNAGVAISPGLIEETLDPGVVNEYVIEVENRSNVEQEYFVFTRNIRSVGDGGVPVFADDFEVTGYELADWITLSETSVVIPGNAAVDVPITLTVPTDAAPGSHFGGVFISADPPEIESSGAAVGYQVANIISIRVSGEVPETAGFRQFSTDKFLYGSQNVAFDIRVENTGNVLVRPLGSIDITNSLGSRVGTVVFNESRAGVFPKSTREFDRLEWTGDGLGFGRYEAIISAVYGDDGARKTMSSTVTFWILPFGIIGPALGVLAVILLVTVIGVRLYIKRALAQVGSNRRLVRSRRNTGPSLSLLLIVSVLIVLALFMLVMLVLFA